MTLHRVRWHVSAAVLQGPPTRWQPADPMILAETAAAKVNLTLSVLGRQPDGYHALESLVAFADLGDRLTRNADAAPGVTLTGPFAAAIDAEDNLAVRAAAAVRARWPGAPLGHIVLDKRLPVAGGIGGGSADAAAVLRLFRKADARLDDAALLAIAATLGADVPVCFHSRAAIMTGTGVEVQLLEGFPMLAALLVNPLGAVPANKTAVVFKALAAPPLAVPTDAAAFAARWSGPHTAASLLDTLAGVGNDLEAPARRIMPMVDRVLTALSAASGARIVRLSGAGPTCFALFETVDAARAAGEELRGREPGWWIVPTVLA